MNSGFNNYFNSFDVFGLLGIGQNAINQVNKISNLSFTYDEWAILSHVDQEISTLASPSFVDMNLSGFLTVDIINEYTVNTGVTIEGVKFEAGALSENSTNFGMKIATFSNSFGLGIQFNLVEIITGTSSTVDVIWGYGISGSLTESMFLDSGTKTLEVENITSTGTITGGTLTDGTAILTGGELSDCNTLTAMEMSGFVSCGGSGNYWSSLADQFTILRPGTGYIKSRLVPWSAPQTVTMIQYDINIIYVDSAGVLQRTGTSTVDLYVNNIVLFEVFYNGSTFAKKENHPYNFQTRIESYIHQTIGTIIQGTGGNINILSPTQINILTDAIITDHGLSTSIIGSAAAITVKFCYMNPAGNWIMYSDTSTFPFLYNNAGIPSALSTSAKWGIYRIYAILDNMNSSIPNYVAVINNEEYSNSTEASNAIEDGNVQGATLNLSSLEPAQLGYVIFKNSGIQNIIIQKSTLNQQFAGGSGGSHLTLADINAGTYGMGSHTGMAQRHISPATDPSVNDDISNYLEGCFWLNSSINSVFVCTDNSSGAAIWEELAFHGSPAAFDSLECDTISEYTVNTGVTIEGIKFENSAGWANTGLILIGQNNNAVSTSIAIGYNIGVSSAWVPGAIYNCFVGQFCAINGTSGAYNCCFGFQAGNLITSGGLNTLIGANSGYLISTGSSNTVVGSSCGRAITTGSSNVCIGNLSDCAAAANYQIAMGYNAITYGAYGISLGANSKSSYLDITIGESAGSASTGSYNVSIGQNSGNSMATTGTDASYNALVGFDAGTDITTGYANTCIGRAAGYDLKTGHHNVFVGTASHPSAGNYYESIAIGYNAIIGANRSIAIGYNCTSNHDGSIAIGKTTKANASDQISIGTLTGNATATGLSLIAIGVSSGTSYSTGSYNISIGASTGQGITTGGSNVCIGTLANAAATIDYQTAIGYSAIVSGSDGISIGRSTSAQLRCVSIGYNCLSYTNATQGGVAIGYQSKASGSSVAIGYQCAYNDTNTGAVSVAIGYRALFNATSALRNVCIGTNTGGSITTTAGYDDNVAIGTSADISGTNSVAIGLNSSGISNSTAIGQGAVAASNEVYLGNGAITSFKCQVNLTVVSDKRAKIQIKSCPQGLDFIKRLKPKTFILKNDPEQKIRHGLIAQSIKKINPNYVCEAADGSLGITYNELIAPMINAIQDLSRNLEKARARIFSLEKKLYNNIVYNGIVLEPIEEVDEPPE